MKEMVCYDNKNNLIWLVQKDVRYERKQTWFCTAGNLWCRPKTTDKAKRFVKKMEVLESANYLDEYRNY